MSFQATRSGAVFNMLMQYLKLMRVHQYVKNVLVFAPIFFFPEINDTGSILLVVLTFVCFSLISSSVYILNDYIDREDDARHPKKKHRPIASGAIKADRAMMFFLGLLTLGFGGALTLLPHNVVMILGLYFFLNLAYSFSLKRVAILDINIIAVGFVLRLFAGGEAVGVLLSDWIVIMTFLLALFLALAKRRDDVLIQERTGESMRKSLSGYNSQFVNMAIVMLATMVLVSYLMYTVSDEVTRKWNSDYIYTTSIFVFLGIMRYLQITFVEEASGSPTKVVLRDRFIQIAIACWIALFAWFIYF